MKLLRFDAQRVTEIQAGDGRILRAEWYVLDIAHQRFSALLPDRMLARYAYFQQIGRLQDVPAVTVHLWLADAPYEPRLLVLADHVFHWVTSRRVVQEGRTLSLVSLVAIGTKIPKDRPDAFLVRAATDLVMDIFELKALPTVWHSMVVRTPHAQLSVGPGSSALRPLQQSPVSNLFVAGSWTDTGLPGTTESAIRSGNLCAEAIVARSTESAP